ncbi:MAG TPA: TlpA family protein disulfide reductase, partial [Phycisphaerales bacterium]|nr:TlpA family protein disulfide reductase [Phycisphaerales bacterium]
MTRNPGWIAAFLALAVSLAIPAARAGDGVVREGIGERRAMLDKMELTDFDQALWAGLTDWINGGPVSAASAEGKVVVFYTWTSYLPTAVRPMGVVNRLIKKYGDRGLVVVGVHGDEGWNDAERVAEQRHAAFPTARDAGGAFRAALHVDQDPDFYVLDRAGRIRYADIETSSLERAVSTLIEETVQDARTLLDRMADEQARARAAARRTAKIRSQINLSDLPWPDFIPPGEVVYKNAPWPKMDLGEGRRRGRRGRDQPTGPVKMNWNSELTWVPRMPEHREGRVTLIYLFNPKSITESARGGRSVVDLFREMDRLQAAHPRDLLVVGAMIPAEPRDNRRRRRGDNENDLSPEQIAENFSKMMEIPVNHVRVSDMSGSLVTARLTPNNGGNDRGG